MQKAMQEAMVENSAAVSEYREGSERALNYHRGPGHEEDERESQCQRGSTGWLSKWWRRSEP
ncbi:MAG: hypothetical protein JW999_00455 [Methanotrichaceae archaeon]|nr:hypothetical protein [Methanotrichaceae archaeon]